jgi:hypothetical protein
MPTATNLIPPDPRPASQAAVRLFFVDKETGTPVCGLLVSVFADSPAVADSRRKSASAVDHPQSLASLQTDQAGYVSFKFDLSIIAGRSRLAVAYGAAQGQPLVLEVADVVAGSDTHTIQLDAATYANIPRHLALPSVMSPDIRDLAVSPGSIGLVPHLLPGGGLCRQLMPTTMVVRRFEAVLIKANICSLESVVCAEDVKLARGKMLEYEITWHPVGTALGDLLNTISLAPCEQVNIAVSDWMRQETASQTEAIDVQQQSFQEMNHERLITEAMQSSVENKGSSWGIAGSLGLSVPIKKLNLTATFGGGYAHSTSTQNVALSTTNQLSEHITQAASFVASQRSTVVFQATTSEQQTYQTRTIRNHNHCHTLTLMYYQVNRNYRVVTDYKGERDVILVKYANTDFDPARVYCNAELLKDALLDQSLLKCFDELADALLCCDQKAVGAKVLMDSLSIMFKFQDRARVPFSMVVSLSTANGPITLPSVNVVGSVQPDGTFTHTFNLPGQIDPTKVTSLVIMFTKFGFFASNSYPVSDVEVTYHAVGSPGTFSLLSAPTAAVIGPVLDKAVTAQLPPTTVGSNPCVDASCCTQKLLAHLNYHKRYYNSVLWLNEDPNERVMRWSCCNDSAGSPFSLITQIENDPIAVYGDFLVFAAAGSQLVDNPLVLPVSKLVTMPTPGVFSEGILGQCDSCEKIDPDRFWDWTKSPCPDSAPAASPPSPKTGVQPSDLKADAISNLITFSSVPGAPDTVLKDLISELVSKADSGSSEAKDLLAKLLDSLKESIPKSSA